MVIRFCKRDNNKSILKNYRRISLLNYVYKLFSMVVMNHLARRLDEFLPSEQVEFRVHVQDQQTAPIFLRRMVRQGDKLSPKLFTSVLKDVSKALD